MSFFTVGFLLSNIQLNLGWGAGYAVKLVGALFILGGIAELGYFAPAVRRERGLSLLLLGQTLGAGSPWGPTHLVSEVPAPFGAMKPDDETWFWLPCLPPGPGASYRRGHKLSQLSGQALPP